MQKLSEILKITYTPVRINDLGLRNNPSEPTGVATFTGTYGQLIRGVSEKIYYWKKISK